MLDLNTFNQFIENSNISTAFGLSVSSFSILILGSFIVGYICLTFYYKVYNNSDDYNRNWVKLESSEKLIVSLFIGFLSIFISQIIIAIIDIVLNLIGTHKIVERTVLQYSYIIPFLYFMMISKIAVKTSPKDLDFIKKYISLSMTAFLVSVGMILIIFGIVLFLSPFV